MFINSSKHKAVSSQERQAPTEEEEGMISSCDDQDGVSMKLGWGCLRTFQEVWSNGQEHGLWSQTVLVSILVSPFTSHVYTSLLEAPFSWW